MKKDKVRWVVVVIALVVGAGCSGMPKPLPECRGTATQINSTELRPEASHESRSGR